MVPLYFLQTKEVKCDGTNYNSFFAELLKRRKQAYKVLYKKSLPKEIWEVLLIKMWLLKKKKNKIKCDCSVNKH